jgi:hypothetical protein
MRPTDLRTDRRAFLLLGAGAGAALLTGCTLNNPFSSARTPAAEAVRDLSPDAAAAVATVTRIRGVQADLEAITAALPRVGHRLSGLTALHEAHLRVLEAAVPHGIDTGPTASPGPLPTAAKAAVVHVRAAEHTLHDQVLAAAEAARSGPFARLLGTVAAGISQQLVELDR